MFIEKYYLNVTEIRAVRNTEAFLFTKPLTVQYRKQNIHEAKLGKKI
jgi:hypothetical protein